MLAYTQYQILPFSQKGGDPTAPSGTVTLLRLHPPYKAYLRQRPPYGQTTGFGYPLLGWCDGRCVQGPGTYSPHRADMRLLAIPTSWSRVSDSNPNYDSFSAFCSTSPLRVTLFLPLQHVCSPGHKGHDDLTSSPPSSGLSPAVPPESSASPVSNWQQGLRSLRDLTQHLTTRADDSHAAPVYRRITTLNYL